ncbi:MAG: DUF5688 family protein [Emergencia sp.]
MKEKIKSYEEFKETVKKEFLNCLPEKYRDWEIMITQIPKVNGFQEGMHLISPDKSGAVPTLYLQELYVRYTQLGDMHQVLMEAGKVFTECMDQLDGYNPLKDLENPESKVIFCLISTERNCQLRSQVPSRPFLDMTLIYRLMTADPRGGMQSAIITDELAAELKLSEEELFRIAVENTPKMLPAAVDAACGVMISLSNRLHTLGAAAMLYSGVLHRIAAEVKDDLYILPSSIHEVFILPAEDHDIGALKNTVRTANREVVDEQEVLSDSVYYYDREKDQILIAEEEKRFVS